MISTKWFEGTDDLSDAYYIRRVVFIDEQRVPEELEFEGDDDAAIHVVVYDNKTAVSCGRVLLKNDKYLISRIAVLKEHRGKKYGDLTVRMLIRKAFDMGAKEVHINAQVQASKFYEKLGFVAYGEVFNDAGIEHIKMIRDNGILSGSCNQK